MEWISDPTAWVGFLTLVALEIVLGIDNLVFISILAARLPPEQRNKARQLGLMLALITRILLLLSISWIMGLTAPIFNILGNEISGRDLVLLIGGAFLIWKSVHEIHTKLEGVDHQRKVVVTMAFSAVVAQILVLDIVFSLDSVITAIGMVDEIGVMISAVVVSMIFMLLSAKFIAEYVEAHPTIKMLALAFLVLIGANLIAEGMGHHIPKGYTYFAMGFAVAVEMLNLRMRRGAPVALKDGRMPEA